MLSAVSPGAERPFEALSFERLFEALPVAAMTCDLDTLKFDYANPCAIHLLTSIEGILDFDPRMIVGMSIDVFDKYSEYPHQRKFLSDLPHRARIRFGHEWLDLHIQVLPDSTGQANRALFVWSMATAEVVKTQEEYRLLRMIDDMPVAVMTIDPDSFKINYINETSKRTLARIEHLLPVKVTELLGASIDVFHTHPRYQRRILSDPSLLPHRAKIKLGPEVLDLQITAVRGTDGAYLGPMLSLSVITEQMAAEARIQHFAHYDTLTGLANRSAFWDHLQVCLGAANPRLALLFIDLDGFKDVNDSYGHLIGDALLRHVGDRLRSHCSLANSMVGRLGGDEFAILVDGIGVEEVGILATDLVEAIVAPYQIETDRRLQIGASIGIALAPQHGTQSEILLSRADMALYAAKASGKKTFRIFTESLESRLQERIALEGKLRKAMETMDGLFLFYQPIVEIGSGRVTAREGLLRWHDSIRGWISPNEFIPVAEDSGLIDELGRWVLKRACRDAASWRDGAGVAVNVSARQLGKGTLASLVLDALIRSGLSPDRLEIEITESALLNDHLDCLGDLRRVRDLGVRVALDDFGTGFSSLAHLRSFPFDKIKIDGSFVRDAVSRPDCAAIVGVLAELGKRLGVKTVAEGVETQAQLDLVAAEGCTEVQGYLIGYPLPAAADSETVAALNRDDRGPRSGLAEIVGSRPATGR